MLGYTDAEFPDGRSRSRVVVHPDDASPIRATLHDHLAQHKPLLRKARLVVFA